MTLNTEIRRTLQNQRICVTEQSAACCLYNTQAGIVLSFLERFLVQKKASCEVAAVLTSTVCTVKA